MTDQTANWQDVCILAARWVLGAVFVLAVSFKIMGFGAIVELISTAGFPFASVLAALAVAFEIAIVVALFTGAFLPELMLAGCVYVVFLAFAFHGPSHWIDPKGLEFGAFINHFPFAAALLLAAGHGPGRLLAFRRSLLTRQ